ncbi:MAG: STT3 domain-containing protein [Candidatus Aenigmatarchaeota archaeon]
MDTAIFSRKNLVELAVVAAALIAIMYMAVYVRTSTLSSPTVLDYDPWWFFRHAREIVENNMQIPKWDGLSYFPPGRPYEAFQGWPYLMALMYNAISPITGMSLTDVAKWSTLIVAAASVVPAYLLGRMLSNKYGGIATALFAVLSPAIIGVSMAGYSDTDMIVVFYTLMSVYSILIAIKKQPSVKAIPYYAFAILVNLAFAWTWGFGWIVLLLFTAFIPALFVFRALEQMMHSVSLKINTTELKSEAWIMVPLLVIILVTNVIGTAFNLGNIIEISQIGSAFAGGSLLLVNVSVAELQQINIFTAAGVQGVIDRVGFAPVLFAVALLPLALYKVYRKEKISMAEIFFFMWVLLTFLMITRGVRFSLLFGTAAAAAGGYVIGNAPNYLKDRFVRATFYGLTAFLVLSFVSTAIQAGYAGSGMLTSANWYSMMDWLKANANSKSLVVTWWDPGHIIAGYTGLRVHADGAHCGSGPTACIPYGHDVRIQDMGRVFSISDEDEALSLLKKYRQLTPGQCAEARQAYGSILPADACDAVPEMYVLASSDLIGKYYWLSYFGTGTGRNFIQMYRTSVDQSEGVISYGDGAISLAYKDGAWIPVLNMPDQGIRNAVIRSVVYFEGGQEKRLMFNESNMIDGTLWVDPSYGIVIFMDPATFESIFTRMFFFNGDGLHHFELVYQNPEIRLYKVVW